MEKLINNERERNLITMFATGIISVARIIGGGDITTRNLLEDSNTLAKKYVKMIEEAEQETEEEKQQTEE